MQQPIEIEFNTLKTEHDNTLITFSELKNKTLFKLQINFDDLEQRYQNLLSDKTRSDK